MTQETPTPWKEESWEGVTRTLFVGQLGEEKRETGERKQRFLIL